VQRQGQTGSAKDRRRHPRFEDEAQALCFEESGAGGFHAARLIEISAEGMRLETGQVFEPGGELYVGVFLDQAREPLVTTGVVQHCAPRPGGATVGLQFVATTQEQRTALALLSDYLERRHGEEALVTLHPAPAIRHISEERWW